MPQMLREEAFHPADGADPQKVLNKWRPRGLELFGNERGSLKRM